MSIAPELTIEIVSKWDDLEIIEQLQSHHAALQHYAGTTVQDPEDLIERETCIREYKMLDSIVGGFGQARIDAALESDSFKELYA